MDLIEQLPASAGHTAILVVVDRLSKQGNFIPTHDTLTAVQLAGLFIPHVFSKHGVPGHVTRTAARSPFPTSSAVLKLPSA